MHLRDRGSPYYVDVTSFIQLINNLFYPFIVYLFSEAKTAKTQFYGGLR